MLRPRPLPTFGYVVAILAVLVATAVRQILDPMLGSRVPFAIHFVAVTSVAFFTSLGPALTAMVASAVLATLLFIPPRRSLWIDGESQITVAFFLVTCGMVIALADRLNRARYRMEASAKAAEAEVAAVQVERARLQEIIASIPGVVWEAWGEPDSSRQRINYVSDHVRDMLGYTPDEWTSSPNFWLQIVAPEDRAAAAEAAAAQFAAGQEGANEFRWVAKDGRLIWVLARSTVIKDEQGKPAGMRGVTFDITDRKETERRLGLLAEMSTTGLLKPSFDDVAAHIATRTADIIGDACVIRIIEGTELKTIASVRRNRAGREDIQPTVQQADPLNRFPVLADLVHRPRTIVLDDLAGRLAVSGAAASDSERMREIIEPDVIEEAPTRAAVLCPLLGNGRVSGFLAVGRSSAKNYSRDEVTLIEALASRTALLLDNARLVETAHRETEQARAARAEAEEAGRVKDEFLATLSHELRTPLNAILGWAHLLQDPRLPADRRQAAIDTIVRNAQSQEQLISDILDVQRIISGKIRLNLSAVDLGTIVRAAAETVQPSADAKQVRLQLLVDLDVPLLVGDPDRLKQIVWNLLSNAIKFAPQGGRVQVRLFKEDKECELVVEDNGPGIAPEFLPFVFERFRQADSSTTRTHRGLGLGLAIVKSLVEMHGGRIAAHNNSASDQTGAIFTIRLPRRGALVSSGPDADGHMIRQAPVWLDEAPALDAIRVLVVEDDADARELIGEILQRCGARVTVAASALEGFDAFTRETPDVLVSDIEMPDEDGFALIRRIRGLSSERGRDVPAAALTAYASAADRSKTLGAGFDIHLAKPVQPAELAKVVASLARKRSPLTPAPSPESA